MLEKQIQKIPRLCIGNSGQLVRLHDNTDLEHQPVTFHWTSFNGSDIKYLIIVPLTFPFSICVHNSPARAICMFWHIVRVHMLYKILFEFTVKCKIMQSLNTLRML